MTSNLHLLHLILSYNKEHLVSLLIDLNLVIMTLICLMIRHLRPQRGVKKLMMRNGYNALSSRFKVRRGVKVIYNINPQVSSENRSLHRETCYRVKALLYLGMKNSSAIGEPKVQHQKL